MRIITLKYILSKYYEIAKLEHRLYIKTYNTNVIEFIKRKRINDQLWLGPLILQNAI